jgi:hypothetical protein
MGQNKRDRTEQLIQQSKANIVKQYVAEELAEREFLRLIGCGMIVPEKDC